MNLAEYVKRNRIPTRIAGIGIIISAILWNVRLRFPFDDVFITFRYAENVASGHGLVWNLNGPHTEGYTNFLFVLLLAGIRNLTADLLTAAQTIGLFCTVLTGVLLFQIASKERNKLAGLFATAFYFVTPLTWINALSGMETSFFVFLCVFSLFFASRNNLYAAFGSVLFATLTRPEGALLGGIIFCAFMVRQNHIPRFQILASAGAFVSLLVLHALWKWSYFGYLFPNSFYVKVLDQNHYSLPGLQYVRLFVQSMIVPLLLTLGIRDWKNGTIAIAAAWSLSILLFYIFALPLEGLYDRFLWPVFPMICILASTGVLDLFSRFRIPAFALIVVLAAYFMLSFFSPRTKQSLAAHEEVWDATMDHIISELKMLPNFNSLRLAYGDAGYVVYRSRIQHIDLFGLNDTRIAHAKTIEERKEIVLDERPNLLLLPIRSSQVTYEWVEDAYGLARDSSFETEAVVEAFPYPLAWVLNKNSNSFVSCKEAIEHEVQKRGSYLRPAPTIR